MIFIFLNVFRNLLVFFVWKYIQHNTIQIDETTKAKSLINGIVHSRLEHEQDKGT